MTVEEFVYKKHMNLKLAAQELGMKWQTLYVRLRSVGVAVVGDKLRYGSASDKLGVKAEIEFNKLVPFAQDQNKVKFQSKFDFLVNGEKVDVKASTLKQSGKSKECVKWAFSLKRQNLIADFIVCFAYHDNEQYSLFLIPGEIVRNYQSISISPRKSKWLDYQITPNELADFFNDLTPVLLES